MNSLVITVDGHPTRVQFPIGATVAEANATLLSAGIGTDICRAHTPSEVEEAQRVGEARRHASLLESLEVEEPSDVAGALEMIGAAYPLAALSTDTLSTLVSMLTPDSY